MALSKIEITNMRAFLQRSQDVKGHETMAHALCLQALVREEQELTQRERNEKIAAEAVARAKETKTPKDGSAVMDQREETQVLPKPEVAE